MQGTVIGIRANGVIATLDGTPEIGDLFEIYRTQNDVETILGKGYIRKPKGGDYKINPMDKEDGSRGDQFNGVQLGDLVRKVSS